MKALKFAAFPIDAVVAILIAACGLGGCGNMPSAPVLKPVEVRDAYTSIPSGRASWYPQGFETAPRSLDFGVELDHARGNDAYNTPGFYVAAFFIAEGLIAVMSRWAARDPVDVGVITALTAPFAPAANSRGHSMTSMFIQIGAFETLALYNLSVDKDKKSEREIFRANVIGWNAAAGITWAGQRFFGRSGYSKNLSLMYVPEASGGRLLLSYKF